MSKFFGKYFNSTTTNGRANVAKATYASIATLYLMNRYRKRGHKTEDQTLKQEDDHNGKDTDIHSHHSNQHEHKSEKQTEASTCPCKCNENTHAANGHEEHKEHKQHNDKKGHHGNHQTHEEKGVDGAHGNHHNHHEEKGADGTYDNHGHPSNNHGHNENHGHHGHKIQHSCYDHKTNLSKTGNHVDCDQTQALGSTESVTIKDDKNSKKSFFSYMDDSVETWGLP